MISCCALLVCHNRRDSTLRALERLYRTFDRSDINLSVVLVDDGSSDGTGSEVQRRFPEVDVIFEDGNRYWNGAMRIAWTHAAQRDFDFYLWLNDDTFLFDDAADRLFAAYEAQLARVGVGGIVIGATADPISGRSSFGVFDFDAILEPPSIPSPIELFNGNIVLVSKEAFRTLGNLSGAYRHSFGDIDYGIRARASNVPVWAAAGHLGSCKSNPLPKWADSRVSFLERLRAMHHPKGCHPVEACRLAARAGIRLWPLLAAKLYLRVIWPTLFHK